MQANLSATAGLASHPIRLALRVVAWGILSVGAFIGVFMALVWPVGQLEQAVGLPHPVHLALWALAWVPISGLLTLYAARLSFGTLPVVSSLAWVLLALGALASAAQIGVLAEWAIRRYGASDPDFIGPTFLLFAMVAGVAVAGFGVQISPRWAVWAPLSCVVVGVAIGAWMMLENVPGLADGVPTDSYLLAGTMVAAALYIGAVGILSLARLRRA